MLNYGEAMSGVEYWAARATREISATVFVVAETCTAHHLEKGA